MDVIGNGQKKTKSSITDRKILELLKNGSITVDIKSALVMSNGKILKPNIAGRSKADGVHGRRWVIMIQRDGIRRTISRGRLVYMAGTMKVIPRGFQIHHCDENPANDAFGNLVKIECDDHAKIHGRYIYPDDDEWLPPVAVQSSGSDSSVSDEVPF